MSLAALTARRERRAQVAGLLAGCLLLAACASAPPAPAPAPLAGTGSYTPVHGANTRRYVLSAGQSFSGATLARFENPVYPPALLPLKLAPLTLVVQVAAPLR